MSTLRRFAPTPGLAGIATTALLSDVLKAGYSPYLEVLDAQRTVNAAELTLIQNQQAQLIYSVDLMKALDGGWSPGDAAPNMTQR